ncbi:MAG: phosphodiester glycosidase family protein [Clostridiales bacterium]|nr:phosphodiester glycosidase family protein [Clostridiales bacterium]
MCKPILFSCLVAASSLSMSGVASWNVNGSIAVVDTLFHATVGPGVVETHMRVAYSDDPAVFNNLFCVTVDLNNPYIDMRVAKAGNTMRYVETVPEISERLSDEGADYIIGFNADFFNTYYPYNSLGAAIANGSLANYATPPAQADIDSYYISFDAEGLPALARHVTLTETGSVMFPFDEGYVLRVNKARGTNHLVLYTPQWEYIDGKGVSHGIGTTGTNAFGAEVKVKPLSGGTLWGSSQELTVVEEPVKGVGNMTIDPDCYVLSGHGDAVNCLMKLRKGDRLKAFMGVRTDNKPAVIKELIAGFPFLLVDNVVQYTPGYPEHLSNREPRTAVGYDQDRTKLTLLVVDGRNAGGSAGVTQCELAYYMSNLGCSEAMNFDGGGSSTIYVKPLGGVRNVPSTSGLDKWRPEGVPRVVVNALFAVNTAPVDREVSSIEIKEKRLDLVTGESYTPTVYGYNRYGTLVDSNMSGCEFLVSPSLARVEGYCLTASDGNCRGDLTVRYGDASYSIPIYINGGEGGVISSGVDDVVIDYSGNNEFTKEYFTPLGQKISNPAPGTFVIERCGNTVVKKVVK